ncbi:MAG: hypothetical protein ACKV19_09445 [Verrucomicrobiales bacterium]
MKSKRTTRRIVLSTGGAALLAAILVFSISLYNEHLGDSVEKHGPVLPTHALPQSSPNKAAPQPASDKPAPVDSLLAGVYADDLAAIKARFLSNAYNADYGTYLSAFAARLAKEDPEAGFAWLLSLESTGDLQLAVIAFARELQNGSPAKVDWALKQSMPPSIYQAFVSGAVSAMVGDLDNALQFITKASTSPIETDWLARSLMVTLSQDRTPAGCLKLMRLADEFPNAVPPEQHGEALFFLWSADPAKAEEIMQVRHDFQSNPAVFASFAELFAQKDLEAASSWVTNLPDGIAKDFAIGSIAKASSHVSPLGGLQWATSIRDNDIRNQMMGNLVDLSAYHDPEATKKIVEQAGFPAEEAAKWLAKINQQTAGLR